MSKRFSRTSKKSTSDENAGNFVFSFPGSASPNQSFTFGGGSSAPSSPIGSPAGFGTLQPPSSPSVPTFGAAPSSPSANSNVFVFGAGAGGASSTSSLPGSPKTSAAFGGVANNTAPNSPNSTLRRNVTEISQPTQPSTFTGAALRRSNSDLGTTASTFSFGSPANTPSVPSLAFTFGGSGQNQAMTSQPAPSSATSATAAPTTTFSFGSTANTATTNTTPSSSFSFGSAPVSAAPSSTGGFASSTIAPSTSSPAPAAFSFGSSTSNATKPTPPPASSSAGTSAFSFGSPAPPPSSTSSPSAGGTTSQFSVSSSPAFSFGTPSTAQKTDTNTTSTPSFSLKMPAPTTTTASSTPAASPFGGSSSTGTAAPGTTATASTATTPSTTASTTTSAPTFGFSIPSSNTAKASAALEKKDDASKPSDKSAAPSTSIFSFGSTAPKPTTTSAPTTSTTSATSTTATPAISGLPSFSATKPATTTTTPATTATTSAPNAFSFTTTLANLDKTAQQPPNQIGAALITPSLNALRQNQVVTHTNFRIDNILPSTRYTELPEQARKELDELAQYIHDESQRCDYIKKRAAPKRQDTMKGAKHEYEILSYKLDSLSNSLQMQVNAVEELFDLLKEQIRHFNDGQSVLDAWKHPGGLLAARRLSGYSNDDDYFMTLSTRLALRMEEYKRCIREIEFTTDSWTKNHAQSPQDIARIMASQNQTFLALTNQVAALHETLKMEQDLYSQYRYQAISF